MNNNIHITSQEAFLNLFKDVQNGKEIASIESADFEIRAVAVEPPPGFIEKENYPNCCGFHRDVRDAIEKSMEQFPNCCEQHKRLLSAPWFSKDNYTSLTRKTLAAISFTEFHVSACVDKEDWYNDITDYFEHIIFSFGQLPRGYGGPVCLDKYLRTISAWLINKKKAKTIFAERFEALANFIENYSMREQNQVSSGDLHILVENYRRWLKAFPFEISYLTHLRPQFERQIIVFAEQPKSNRYMKTAKARMYTYQEQINALISITAEILRTINGRQLYEDGHLTEPQGKELELINAARRLELDDLIKDKTDGRQKYIRLIKKWMKGEKKYFKEITPILLLDIQNTIFND